MIEMATISAAVNSLQSAADIAKGLIGLRDTAMIQGKVIELQSAILAAQTSALAAQSEQFSLLQKIRGLEEEIARVKAWEGEKVKYELRELQPRSFAYAIKPEAKGSQPSHYICANCYEHGEKRILQQRDHLHLACPHCKTAVQDKLGRSFNG
ncbi:MAG TPA: hypothetical protein VFI23_03380 [Rhizomicrobium sp.]|nr:hypothetical protein [Rhizomicrobium sp.]